ncbi:hypothetical protein BSPWISOXPB_6650 [uncultured Gammaproteobacteria bacterium]|nr:hypothetical protein BSPWISOXPB_6650 [uncultured Gammaproteobacteria bacterium]
METGGPCLEDKGDNVASGDNTGWFYDVPFQHFGEQDTTILELDNSNDLSQYFTNSDDFLILELDDIIDCGGKVLLRLLLRLLLGLLLLRLLLSALLRLLLRLLLKLLLRLLLRVALLMLGLLLRPPLRLLLGFKLGFGELKTLLT